MGTRTISLDFLKQTTSMNGAVTRRGEWGEELRVIPYENGTRMEVNVNNSSAYLKGVTPDGKYCEIKGQVTGTSTNATFRFFLTKDWNSAAGNFKVAYVEFKNEPNIITSTVNLDWYVLDNATITDSDSAHYIDELQELIDRLQQQANDFMDRMATQLQGTQDKLDQLDQYTNAKINEINQRLTNINIEIANALEEFRNGDFYTKTEADNRFMKKGEVPDTIQKFKLTADDGQPLPIPSGVTSFGDLAKYTGYFYVPRATAITYTDHDSLPINFRNSGLFVYMPVGQPTNAYRYQEIRLNSTTFARGAFRNTNGVSTTPWVEFANEASITTITNNVSDQGRRIATNAMNITTNSNRITALETPKYWKGYFTAGKNVEPIRHRSRMAWGTLLTTQAELDGLQPMEVPFTVEPLFLTAKRDIKFILRGHWYLQGSGGSNPRWAYAHARINTDGGEATGSATPMGSVQNGASGVQWKNWVPFTALLTMKAGEKLAFSIDVDESQTGKHVDRGHIEQFYIQEVPADPATLELRSYAADHERIYN